MLVVPLLRRMRTGRSRSSTRPVFDLLTWRGGEVRPHERRCNPCPERSPRPGERRRSTLIYMALAFRAAFLPSRTLTCLLLSMDGPHHGSTGDSSPKRSRTRRQRQFAARKYFFLRGLFVGLYVSFPGGVVLVGSVCWWGGFDGLVGPDVSKTEAIKAPVAWVSPKNHAMTWCFRRVSGVPRCGAAWRLG